MVFVLIDRPLFLNFCESFYTYFLPSLLSLTEVKIKWQNMNEHPREVTAAATASAAMPDFEVFQ